MEKVKHQQKERERERERKNNQPEQGVLLDDSLGIAWQFLFPEIRASVRRETYRGASQEASLGSHFESLKGGGVG